MENQVQNKEQVLNKRRNMFFSGVIILTIANILIKVLGMAFKIPLVNLIGSTGMGYFNKAYTIYTWLYMISTGGIPVAISIIISDCRAKGRYIELSKVYKIAMRLLAAIGFLGTAAMIITAIVLKQANGNNVYLCMIGIAPTLFFICIASAMRGYFQGYQNMLPTALSELVEALGKLILGLLFANYAINVCGYSVENEPHIVAAFAISGVTVGVLLGMALMFLCKILFKVRSLDLAEPSFECESTKKLCKKIITLAIPITISSSVMSLASLIDSTVVCWILQYICHMTELEATTVYGNYSGYAVPLFNMPPALIYPISYSIVPVIASAVSEKDAGKKTSVTISSFKIAALIATPSALGLSVLAKPILMLLYSNRPDEVNQASPLLSILAFSVFCLGILTIGTSTLQACGYERKPIISMGVGAVVKILTSLILVPFMGIYGAPVGSFLCYMTATVLNMYFVVKYCGVRPKIYTTFIKPLFASLVCAAAAFGSYELISNFRGTGKLTTLASIVIAVFVYAVAVFLTRSVSRDDILLLPKGQKIANLLTRLKLIK